MSSGLLLGTVFLTNYSIHSLPAFFFLNFFDIKEFEEKFQKFSKFNRIYNKKNSQFSG
jgi:hypothetical protein